MAALSDLFTSGTLGPVKLGDTKADVRRKLGDPQDVSTSRRPLLWKYGTVELAFPDAGENAPVDSIHLRSPDGRLSPPRGMEFSDWSAERMVSPAELAGFLKTAGLECLPDASATSETQLSYFVPPRSQVVFAADEGEPRLYGVYVSGRESANLKTVSVRLDANDFERIKEAALRAGVSVAALCKTWLEERARSLP